MSKSPIYTQQELTDMTRKFATDFEDVISTIRKELSSHQVHQQETKQIEEEERQQKLVEIQSTHKQHMKELRQVGGYLNKVMDDNKHLNQVINDIAGLVGDNRN